MNFGLMIEDLDEIKIGLWFHHIEEASNRRVIQNIIEATNHLRGAKWGT